MVLGTRYRYMVQVHRTDRIYGSNIILQRCPECFVTQAQAMHGVHINKKIAKHVKLSEHCRMRAGLFGEPCIVQICFLTKFLNLEENRVYAGCCRRRQDDTRYTMSHRSVQTCGILI